jgi:hypothetical protein
MVEGSSLLRFFENQGANGAMQSISPITAMVRAKTNAMPPATTLRQAGWTGALSFAAARDLRIIPRLPLAACIGTPSG